MDVFHWFGENWFVFLQAIGIVGGLLFTGVSLRADNHTQRVANLLKITEQHRKIWSELFSRPDLKRVLSENVNLKEDPLRDEEELFVLFLILHLSSAYSAMRDQVLIKPAGVQKDVAAFFSHPIPAAVREKLKPYQNAAFVRFIESCRRAC